jgi:hypothetical protein
VHSLMRRRITDRPTVIFLRGLLASYGVSKFSHFCWVFASVLERERSRIPSLRVRRRFRSSLYIRNVAYPTYMCTSPCRQKWKKKQRHRRD